MPRPRHYVPCIKRAVVCALYHEAKARRQSMTKLVNKLLTDALKGTRGWQIANSDTSIVQEPPESPSDQLIQSS